MKKLLVIGFACFALHAEDTAGRDNLPKRISETAVLKFQILQSQVDILRLQECSRAEIKESECEVRWEAGIVLKRIMAIPPPAADPKIPEKPNTEATK